MSVSKLSVLITLLTFGTTACVEKINVFMDICKYSYNNRDVY